MADAMDASIPTTSRGRAARILIPMTLALIASTGFTSSYLSLWAPTKLFSTKVTKARNGVETPQFVELPQLSVTLPGPDLRKLYMSIQIEAKEEARHNVELLRPRLLDAYTNFLSELDPSAFESRGILSIIRAELATRTSYIVGSENFSDILITEFHIK